MKKNAQKQYTIRSIPDSIDRTLRKRAMTLKKSFNQVALEALALGTGERLLPSRDFSEIAGSLSEAEAKKIDQEIRLQKQIDETLWK